MCLIKKLMIVVLLICTFAGCGNEQPSASSSGPFVHVVYLDAINYSLKYATNKSGSWVTQVLDDQGDSTGFFPSIAIDKNNKLHVSYYDLDTTALKYISNKSGVWVKQVVDDGGTNNVGWYNSIAVDSENKPYISYYSANNQDLKMAFINSSTGQWAISTVDSADQVGEFSSMAIDYLDRIHISYYDRTNNRLKRAMYYPGTGFSFTTDFGKLPDGVTEGGIMPNEGQTSIAVDSEGHSYIAFYYFDNLHQEFGLKYAQMVNIWRTRFLDSDGKVGSYNSIDIDQSNNFHISYFDRTNDKLKYATGSFDYLSTTEIDNVLLAEKTSIKADKKGFAHITYFVLGSGLKYATNKNGVWANEFVDQGGNVGQYCSMALSY